jgi:hypothetical protein
MIARSAPADAEHAAAFVADDRGGAGLAAVDTQEISWH